MGYRSAGIGRILIVSEREKNKMGILPASMTFDPGLMFSQEVTNAISARYKIWVRCGRAMVQSSGVGRRTWMKPRP